MNVYVETNFVLELALAQEQQASCEEILTLSEAGGLRLVIPSYSLVEPYEALHRRRQNRMRVKRDPEVVEKLAQHRCKLLSRFDDGYRYVRHVLSSHAS